jgi:hypothetical protein
LPTGVYYTCKTTLNPASCAAASATSAQKLQNPVTLFSSDNNGVIVELPSPPAGGTASLTGGALVFGIDTESNNALGSATVLLIDGVTGFVQASFNGSVGLNAALDSARTRTHQRQRIAACTAAAGFYWPGPDGESHLDAGRLAAASAAANSRANLEPCSTRIIPRTRAQRRRANQRSSGTLGNS